MGRLLRMGERFCRRPGPTGPRPRAPTASPTVRGATSSPALSKANVGITSPAAGRSHLPRRYRLLRLVRPATELLKHDPLVDGQHSCVLLVMAVHNLTAAPGMVWGE